MVSVFAERAPASQPTFNSRHRLDAMAEELHQARRQALDLSKRCQKLKETAPKMVSAEHVTTTTLQLLPSTSSAPSKPKFVGGGFNLQPQPPIMGTM